jgi:hypothetical protein
MEEQSLETRKEYYERFERIMLGELSMYLGDIQESIGQITRTCYILDINSGGVRSSIEAIVSARVELEEAIKKAIKK